MWDPDTPQQIYTRKIDTALEESGIIKFGRDNQLVCNRCGCYIFNVNTHLLACSSRTSQENAEHLRKVNIAGSLIVDATYGFSLDIKDKAKEIVKQRFSSQCNEEVKIIGMTNRNEVLDICTEHGVIDAHHFDVALRQLTDSKVVFVQNSFASISLRYQDVILVRLGR